MIRATRGCNEDPFLGSPKARALEKLFSPKRLPNRKEALFKRKFLLSMGISFFSRGFTLLINFHPYPAFPLFVDPAVGEGGGMGMGSMVWGG